MDSSLNIYSSPISHIQEGMVFKRHLRIKTSKLPHDFFSQSPTFRYELTPLVSQELSNLGLNRCIQTPTFQRRQLIGTLSKNDSYDVERKVQTARAVLQKVQSRNIMRESFSIRKQLGRVERKLSLGEKLERSSSPDRHLRLPKLLKKGILAK